MSVLTSALVFAANQAKLLRGHDTLHAAEELAVAAGERVKSRLQALFAALSSLFYLIPAVAYAHGSDHFWNDVGCILFVGVAVASACADGSVAEATWLGKTNRAWLRRVRLTDRWMATSAGAFAILPNVWPFHSVEQTVCVLLTMLIAIAPLHAARKTHHSFV